MQWIADLHIHSKYSRACSRDLELENLAWWAQRKGITLLGTGDFTHPAWSEHLREHLVPDDGGLYRLRPEREEAIRRKLPGTVHAPVRFMLSVEISTIYKRGDRTRKVHHLIYLPDLDAVARFNTRLGKVGNLGSDGRPILGLDSRDLLEIVLATDDRGFLVPAHIWTPWFSALGSRSGFDAIADCYADLAHHIKAVETGLSSDPEMNWRVSSLDGYQLLSNSDAHSPPALAREATILTGPVTYAGVRRALDTGDGLVGTLEFFPEEGKYHADGHRACGVTWEPAESRKHANLCPKCGKTLTIGVLHRVEELADRPADAHPAGRPASIHLIQLAEILGEIHGVGPRSKTVDTRLAAVVAALGPELGILRTVPLDEITKAGGELLGEAIGRLRRGQVRRTAGYDGEYGAIKLFDDDELGRGEAALFDIPAPAPKPKVRAEPVPQQRKPRPKPVVEPPAPPPLAQEASPHGPWEPMLAGMEEVGTGLLDRLDALQRVAASAPGGPLLIVAGPGTGKTRTLTHRIAYLCAELGVFPEHCLAITFTRRSAEELRHRLSTLLGPVADDIFVGTFHALGLQILRDNPAAVGLSPDFRVADDQERQAVLVEALDLPRDPDGTPSPSAAREARKLLAAPLEPGLRERYAKLLRQRDRVDLDELLTLPVSVLDNDPYLLDRYQGRWRWVFVDEYQDVDAVQYELLRLLVPHDGNLCAIGDPDQSIYSFRGADVGYFLRFTEDYSDARVARLTRNYRSSAPILAAAVQAVAPTSLVPGRRLDPAKLDPEAPQIGLYAAPSVAAEAEWVARTIDDLIGGVSHRSFDGGRVDSRADRGGLSFPDIAVLYRTDAQAAPIVEALTRAGIPVQKRSHDRLMARRGVPEIARELRFGAGTGSLVDRVRAAGRTLATRSPGLFEQDLPDLSDTDVYSAVEVLLPLAARVGDNLEEFLQALATGAEVDAWDPRAQTVTLLTLHAAKGLEWPVVFMVGCEDGLLPLRFPGTTPTDHTIAEERRLFFVGLTRAQDRLFLSHTTRRLRHGTEYQPARTPFLDPVDVGLLDRMGATDEPKRPAHRQLRLI